MFFKLILGTSAFFISNPLGYSMSDSRRSFLERMYPYAPYPLFHSAYPYEQERYPLSTHNYLTNDVELAKKSLPLGTRFLHGEETFY